MWQGWGGGGTRGGARGGKGGKGWGGGGGKLTHPVVYHVMAQQVIYEQNQNIKQRWHGQRPPMRHCRSMYSFIQLSELRLRRMNETAQISKRQQDDSNLGPPI